MPRIPPPEHLARELEALSFAIAHDLRQPLLGARLALDGLEAPCTPERHALGLAVIRSSLDEALDRIQGLLRLAGLAHDVPQLRTVQVAELARACCDRLELLHPTHPLRVAILGDARVDVDVALLGIVFDNLLENAITHASQPDRALTLTIEIETRGQGAWIAITDDGPGIRQTHGRSIFDPFVRLSKRGRTGIGLATASRAVRALGGELTLDSTHPSGARFHFSVAGAAPERVGRPVG
jgi:signal transduction histidine kinase